MNKKELKKAFDDKLIDEQTYKQKLFELETAPKEKKARRKTIPKAVRIEEFKELIKHIPEKDKIARVSFLLAYGAGLRVSEIVGGKREDGQPIPILTKDKVRDNSILLEDAKYGKDRVVPLPKGWKSWMTDLLPIKRTARSLERKFKVYAKEAKLPEHYTFHSLRHGFAVRLLESGVPANQVQLLLGHSNLATTSRYVSANPVDALKSYEELF